MFSKLVGNDNVRQTLRRFLKGGRVPNSMLFAGDEGIGKRQFALELAKAFVCTEPAEHESCGACPACRRADVLNLPTSDKPDDYKRVHFTSHPDIGSVLPLNRTLYVDAIREVEREANFHPYEASARFLIIDKAEKMNDAAANALLKTLEEPCPTSHIFLITSRPDSLLATIRSRCQILRFAPVDISEIETFLVSDRAFTHDEARLAARLSRGSVGRALSISVEQFRIQRERMLSVISTLIRTSEKAPLIRASEAINDARSKPFFEENLDILQSLIHDTWTLRTGGDGSRIVNSDISDQLASLASQAKNADLPGWLREIDVLRENLIVNINRRIATDALFVKMAGA
jgi:DNA polymerase-3 subunit delta'